MPFESRRRARDEKREAVLRTAVQLFLEQGYHRATLNEVAERLNITKPALYNYFRGKDEILFECWALGQERVDEFIAEIDAGDGTGLVKLRKLVRAYAEVMATDFGASLVRFDARDLSEKNRRIVRAAKRSIDRTFRKYIARGNHRRLDQAMRPQDDRIHDCRIPELDRSLVQARTASSRRRRSPANLRFGSPKGLRPDQQERGPRTADRKQTITGRITMNITHGLRRALQINPDGLATVFGEQAAELARDRRAGIAAGRRASRARRQRRRPRRDPVAQLRSLSRTLSRHGWAGAVIVPLNIRWSPLENEDAMRDCRANVLVVDKAFAATGAALAKALPGLKLVYADDGDVPAGMEGYEALVARSEPMPDAMRASADLAGIFYTGGTTGRSKGRDAQPRQPDGQRAERARRRPVSRHVAIYLHAAPMFHLANGAAMYSLLLSGGSNVIIQAFTPEGVMAAVQNETRDRRAAGADHDPDAGRSSRTRRLRPVVAAGMSSMAPRRSARPCSTAPWRRLPNVQFTQAYGMTELSPIATLLHWNEHIGDGRAKGRHRSAGRRDARLRGAHRRCRRQAGCRRHRRRDRRARRQCHDGLLGAAGGDRQAVIDGWMHTGDGGYMDEDGFVYVVDRVKDMIISGGENVYSAEVENAIAQHPAVAQCAVIGIPSERWGEQVHAVVVTRSGAKVSADELIEFCKTLIAGYKCPRSVEVTRDPAADVRRRQDSQARTAQAVLGKPPAAGELRLRLALARVRR